MVRLRSLLVTLGVAFCLLMVSPATAAAAPSHFNTLPYPTGCASNVLALSSKNFRGGTATVFYSRTCGTNWIEWYGPAVETAKNIKSSYNNQWTAMEWDYTRWAYSRQVYAPGNTSIEGFIHVTTGSGREAWTVKCSSSCQWTQNLSYNW